jgi:hypothetical protein
VVAGEDADEGFVGDVGVRSYKGVTPPRWCFDNGRNGNRRTSSTELRE